MKRNLIILLVFIMAGTAIYWNSFNNSFHYDDELIIVYNRNIQNIKNLPYFFTDPGMSSSDPHIVGHYRPLLVASYAVNYAVEGLNTRGYHQMNLAFHLGTAFLVYLIVNMMLSNIFSAIAAALFFLVHPFNAEAVNYITARSSLMSGFFYLLSFYWWIKFRKVKSAAFYLGSLMAFIAGMLSKEVVITLPLILWLYDLFFYRFFSIPEDRSTWSAFLFNWRNYLYYLPYIFIVIIPYVLIRLVTLNKFMDPFQRDLWTQLFTQLPVLFKHWKMFVIPSPLTPFHFVKIEKTLFSSPVILSAIFLLAYMIMAFFFFRRQSRTFRVASFFMLWFFIVLLPTTIIPLNAIFQENRGYLAIVSFVVLAGILIREIHIRFKWAGVGLLVILTILYSGVTYQRNEVWKDEVSLWSDAAKKVPLSPEVFTALGVAYRRAGMDKEAIDASLRALELGGHNNFFVHENLGRIYAKQDKLDLAIREFEMSIKAYPYKADTRNELGAAYFKTGKMDLAEREFLEGVKLDPEFYRPYFNLGILYADQGRVEEAIKAYQKVISLNPAHLRTNLHLGILLDDLGRKDDAIRYYNFVIAQGTEGDNILIKEAKSRLGRMKKQQ